MDIGNVGSILNICIAIAIIVGVVKLVTASKRGYGKSYKIKTIVATAFLVIIFWAGGSILDDEMDQSGDYIKAQHPVDIPDITYGQAIDSLCKNQEWSRVTSEASSSGQAIVQMDADCTYGDEKHRITIQFNYGVQDFELITEDTPFEITFIGFDDAQSVQISDMQDLVYEMFVYYANMNGIALNESEKYNILYSAGQ